MLIPAYIIDAIQKERKQRDDSVFGELSIEKVISENAIPDNPREESSQGVEEIDFFI